MKIWEIVTNLVIFAMLDKINFVRSITGIYFLFFSLLLEGKEFAYRFQWLSLPVASMSIEFEELFYSNNDINPQNKNFSLSTQGPLKIYRKYSSQGYIKYDAGISWDYYLSGNDRGQPEEKHITYFYNMAPKIRKFIDDYGVSPIIVDPKLDKNAIDPFSVLLRTIDQLALEKQCKNEYVVMDGKRRYKVKVELLEKKINFSEVKIGHDDTLYHCIFTLTRLAKEQKKWPFNKEGRSIGVWFSSDLDYKPIRFDVKTPIGRIIGDYVID